MRTDDTPIRLTSKYQATVPKHVRAALGLKSGDAVRFKVKGGEVVLEKASPRDTNTLRSLDQLMSEWHSPEDDKLFKDL